jgi:hypothetical protein
MCCGCDCCLGVASDFCTCWVCQCTSLEDNWGDDSWEDEEPAEMWEFS